MKMVQCAGCDRPILDRFLLNVLDRSWHARCVQCYDCKCSLSEKCFSRDGKLYCRQDFFKRFGTKCSGCCQGISPSDLVRRARNKVFHLKCFTCLVCRKQLSTGEELYVLDENRFICKADYMNSSHGQVLAGHSPAEPPDLDETTDSQPDMTDVHDMDLDMEVSGHGHRLGSPHGPSPPGCNPPTPAGAGAEGGGGPGAAGSGGSGGPNDENQPGGTKRRGPRTTIKAKQLETLKAAFAATPKPTRHIREQLAQETGLNMRVIQVWFQNRRSKERRMKQLSTLGARRHFFRSPRRAMRPLRPGMSPDGLDDSPEMVGGPSPGFAYFSDSSNPGGDFGYGPPPHQGAFYDFFPGQPPPEAGPPMGPFGAPQNGGPPPPPTAAMDNPAGPGPVNLASDAPYLQPHSDMINPRSSPESVLSMGPEGGSGSGGATNGGATGPGSGGPGYGVPRENTFGLPLSESPVW